MYIRIALSLVLLCGVYTETGIWTTLALFLVLVETETEIYKRQKRRHLYSATQLQRPRKRFE